MPHKSTKYNSSKIVLFLISPFLSLIYSLKSMDTKSSLRVLFFFCVFFGMAFTVSNIRTEGSSDGVSYRASFEEYCSTTDADYKKTIDDYLTFSGKVKDIYADTMSYVVSRFSDNYHVFFMFIAIIFAFFHVNSIKFLTQNPQYNNNLTCLLLLLLFSFVQIKEINGLRFWTAYWVVIYALFNLIIKQRKKYIIFIFISPLIHASYVVVWILFLIYYVFKKFTRIWIILLIISIFFSNYSILLIQDNAGNTPAFLLPFVDYYADDKIVSAVNSSGSGFYIFDKIFSTLVNLYLNIALIFIYIRSKSAIWKKEQKLLNLLSITLIFVAFSNFVMPIPSLGKRFFIFSYPLISYLWLTIIGNKQNSYVLIMPIIFIMAIYHLLLAYVENVDSLFYVASPIVDIFRYII